MADPTPPKPQIEETPFQKASKAWTEELSKALAAALADDGAPLAERFKGMAHVVGQLLDLKNDPVLDGLKAHLKSSNVRPTQDLVARAQLLVDFVKSATATEALTSDVVINLLEKAEE